MTVGDFNKSWRDIPLADEFQVCQHKAAAALVRELGDHAERLLGRPLIRSVNIPVTEPLSFLFAPHVSYFCAEVGQYARYDRPMANTVFVYKVADALGKGLACMAHGGEWAYIAEHKLPGLVRTWIAQAYAFGQCFMCPVSQWATNKKKGSHIYSSKPEEYAHLYQFVRQHAVLFDDYDEAANVAVVYSTRAYRLGYRDALRASIWLTARNVGHHVVIAGDEALPQRITDEQLSRYRRVVIAHQPFRLDDGQQAVLDRAAARGALVTYDAKTYKMSQPISPSVIVDGARVLAVPRLNGERRDAQAVVHLLNKTYNVKQDRVTRQEDFTISVDAHCFPGRAFSKAMCYAPKTKPITLRLRNEEAGTKVTVPRLALWAIVTLE